MDSGARKRRRSRSAEEDVSSSSEQFLPRSVARRSSTVETKDEESTATSTARNGKSQSCLHLAFITVLSFLREINQTGQITTHQLCFGTYVLFKKALLAQPYYPCSKLPTKWADFDLHLYTWAPLKTNLCRELPPTRIRMRYYLFWRGNG